MTETTTPLTDAQKRYRELLGEGEAKITEFTVRFPAPHGPHVYKLGDTVVFTERGCGYSGTITKFERIERTVYAHVETAEHGLFGVQLARALFEGHPDADAMLAPKPHLPLGTLVRVSLPNGKKTIGGIADGELAVVLADKIELVNVARLGGARDPKGRAGDLYARMQHAHLAVVTVDPRTGAITE